MIVVPQMIVLRAADTFVPQIMVFRAASTVVPQIMVLRRAVKVPQIIVLRVAVTLVPQTIVVALVPSTTKVKPEEVTSSPATSTVDAEGLGS